MQVVFGQSGKKYNFLQVSGKHKRPRTTYDHNLCLLCQGDQQNLRISKPQIETISRVLNLVKGRAHFGAAGQLRTNQIYL